MAITVPLWGDGSKWGDGDLWARQYGSTPYIARFYSTERPILTAWNLQSPDGTVWVPSITIAGIVSFTGTAGATASTDPVVFLGYGTVYTPTIANTGIVTLTTATDTRQALAAILDPDDVLWYGLVDTSPIAYITTRQTADIEPKMNRVSVRVTWTGSSAFVIDSIRPLANIDEEIPERFEARTDVDTGERISVRVTVNTTTAFAIDQIRLLANTRHQQPTG